MTENITPLVSFTVTLSWDTTSHDNKDDPTQTNYWVLPKTTAKKTPCSCLACRFMLRYNKCENDLP